MRERPANPESLCGGVPISPICRSLSNCGYESWFGSVPWPAAPSDDRQLFLQARHVRRSTSCFTRPATEFRRGNFSLTGGDYAWALKLDAGRLPVTPLNVIS